MQDYQAMFEAAKGHLGNNKPAAALAILDQIAAAGVENEGVLFGRGMALLILGDNCEADKISRQMLAQYPDAPTTHHLHARVAWAMGRRSDAQQSFERMMQLQNHSAQSLIDYAMFMARERGVGPAEQAADRALKAGHDQSEAWEAMGVVRIRQRRLHEAKAMLQRALELDPANQSAMSLLAIVADRQGDSDRAVALAKLSGEVDEQSPLLKDLKQSQMTRKQNAMLMDRKEVRDELGKPHPTQTWFKNWNLFILAAMVILFAVGLSLGHTGAGAVPLAIGGSWLLIKYLTDD